MTRMLGRQARGQCPYHHAPAGRDCPDDSRTVRSVRRSEERQWHREVYEELAQQLDDEVRASTPYGQLPPGYWQEMKG